MAGKRPPSNAELIRSYVKNLERDRDELLDALRDLASYVGGGPDDPVSHPCGRAHAVLRRFEGYATKSRKADNG